MLAQIFFVLMFSTDFRSGYQPYLIHLKLFLSEIWNRCYIMCSLSLLTLASDDSKLLRHLRVTIIRIGTLIACLICQVILGVLTQESEPVLDRGSRDQCHGLTRDDD